jgi:hypothetical protein
MVGKDDTHFAFLDTYTACSLDIRLTGSQNVLAVLAAWAKVTNYFQQREFYVKQVQLASLPQYINKYLTSRQYMYYFNCSLTVPV